jgi:hypothetical protein
MAANCLCYGKASPNQLKTQVLGHHLVPQKEASDMTFPLVNAYNCEVQMKYGVWNFLLYMMF